METAKLAKLVCPYCGWIRTIPESILDDEESTAPVVRDPSESLKNLINKIKEILHDTSIKDANAWIDIPKCPRCRNAYRYNVKTKETSP